MELVFILMFFLFSSPSLVANAADMREENGRYFLDCRFENRAELCHIDTGAYNARVKSYEPFDSYPSLGKTKSKGVSGEVIESDLIRLHEVRADDLKQNAPVVATLPTSFPFSVLGLEFFEVQAQVKFDFSRNEVRKERLKSSCPKKFVFKDKLIQIPVAVRHEEMLAAWDTGASLNVVNIEVAKKRPDQFEFIRDLTDGGDSSGALVRAKLYKLKSLSLCGREFSDLEVVAVDLTKAKEDMPDFPNLFIGANLMIGHVWSFNFKNQRWFFE